MTTTQLKISFYGLATAILAGLFGYLIRIAVASGNQFWLTLSVGLVFLAFYVLQILLIKDFWIFIASLVQALILGFFAKTILWGLLVFVIFMLWAVWRGRGVATTGLKIDLGSLNRIATPIAITAMSILIAFVYTPTLVNPDLTVGAPVVTSIFGPALPFLQNYVPGISLDMNIRELLKSAGGSFLPKEISALPLAERNAVIAQSEGQLIQSINDSLGIRIGARDSVLNLAVKALNAQLAKIPKDYRQYIDLGLGLLVFLTIKGFGFIFAYIVYLLILLIYFILRSTNFITIAIEKVDKENIQI